MTTAATPYLVADAAHVTIMRPLASTAFGRYSLQVPDGIDIEDIHTFAAPGNELGYVGSLVKGRRVGGWARRFVRADVSVTAKDDDDPIRVSESNVDAVLREARDRTAGDFFLESSITQAGLGPWVPLTDFGVGDIVNVEIFGRVVQLPVTRIEPVVDDAVVVGWTVHVGGQVVGDSRARENENAEIRRALIRDQRDLAGIEAQVSKAVRDSTDAKSTASSAKTAAESASTAASEALSAVHDAEGAIRKALDGAAEAEEKGRGYAKEAADAYELAKGAYENAQSALAEMERLLSESDEILDKNSTLRDEISVLHSQVSALGAQISVANGKMRELADEASTNAEAAKSAAAQARQATDEAADVREKVAVSVREAQQAIADGRKYVSDAQSHAQSAAGAVADAQKYASEAKQQADAALATVESVSELKTQAQSASTEAGRKLKQLQAESKELLSKVDAEQNKILQLHQGVLDMHGEIADAHGEAIRAVARGVQAAGAAAGSASMGAMYAQLTADDASRAAKSALDAAEKNQESIVILGEAQQKLEAATRKLSEANEKNTAAINNLKDATKLQTQINADLREADAKLADAQAKLEKITKNLEEAQRATNQAVRAVGAAAGFAAQTGMHAAQTGERAAKAAESALEANRLNGEAIKKLDQAVLAAKYTTEYNKVLAANYAPKDLYIHIRGDKNWFRKVETIRDESGVIITAKVKIEDEELVLPVIDAPGTVFATLEIGLYEDGFIYGKLTNRSSMNIKDSINGAMTVPLGGSHRDDVSINGVLHPLRILPMYQKQLDALDAKYRKLGLDI